MDNFTKLPKMQCFKEGGTVQREVKNFTKRDRKTMDSADIKQDKAIVKKALAMHDKQEHPGEKTDLSKLKKGGRAKKDVGTVKKYKTGGEVTNVYQAKKKSGDKDNIRKTKLIKPAMAAAPSAPIDNLQGVPMEFKKGGKIKKYSGEEGSYVTKAIDAVKSFGRDIKNNIMGTPEQNRIAQEDMNKQAREGSKLAKFFGGKADTESAPVAKCGGGKMKRGGRAC